MSDLSSFNRFKKAKKVKETKDQIAEAWFYPRVSSKNQFDTNDSIENQDMVSREYARKNGIHISKVFGGTYESASGDFTRKEFMRLINEIKRSRKRPKYILIYIMSRFSRTGGNAISLANMLVEDLGVHIIETSSGLSTETDLGKMSVYQKLLEARKETISRLDSTIPGMKSALRNGKWLGAVPKGYTKYGPRVVDPERFSPFTRVEINEEGKLLKLAWKWKARGERDVDILRKLKDKGYQLDDKRLSELWRKPFYAGIIVHSLIDEVVQGDWEAMVSQKDFLKINERIENSKTQLGYNKENEEELRPLNGDLICSECSSKLVGYHRIKRPKTKKGVTYHLHYYRCYKCNAAHVNANSTPNSKFEGLHDQFRILLSKIQFDKSFAKAIELTLLKIISNRSEEAKKELKGDKKRVSEYKKELETIEERFALGKIPDNLYEKFSDKLENQILDLEQKIEHGNFSTANLSKKIKTALENIQSLDVYWDKGKLSKRKRLQNILFPDGIVVDADSKQLRTDNINRLILVINKVSGVYKKEKSGLPIYNIEKSASVPKAGIEPARV